MQFMSKVAAVIVGLSPCCFQKWGDSQTTSNLYSQLFLCSLWAEIEAHKWRDLELNLIKTATKAIEF